MVLLSREDVVQKLWPVPDCFLHCQPYHSQREVPMRVTFEVQLNREAAFEAIVDELRLALNRTGIELQTGAAGELLQSGAPIGRVTRWNPPERIGVEWIPASWQTEDRLHCEIRFEPMTDGTLVTVEQPGWSRRLHDDAHESAGWIAGQVLAPLLGAMSPEGFGDWLTDRRARRPAGAQARNTYRDPVYHRPNFLAILDILRLRPADSLVEIGCGGGAFLHDALQSGCRAAAIDHSADMVRTASELNRDSIAAGRLEIHQADAGSLPFADDAFTCAVMTGVFGFIEHPVQVLAEIHRVLAPGGRLALFTATKELRGTPAAPEPMASRLHWYENDELEALARRAGFAEAHHEHRDFGAFAERAGVPEEAIPLFRNNSASQLLVATK
jgi:SAM-dependent methyltransferase